MKHEIHYQFYFPWEDPIHRPLLQPFKSPCRDHRPWFEFFLTFTLYGGFFVGMQPQIYELIHLEMSLHSMFPYILFLLILGNLQVIFQSIKNFLTFFNPILSLWSSTITENVVNKLDAS